MEVVRQRYWPQSRSGRSGGWSAELANKGQGQSRDRRPSETLSRRPLEQRDSSPHAFIDTRAWGVVCIAPWPTPLTFHCTIHQHRRSLHRHFSGHTSGSDVGDRPSPPTQRRRPSLLPHATRLAASVVAAERAVTTLDSPARRRHNNTSATNLQPDPAPSHSSANPGSGGSELGGSILILVDRISDQCRGSNGTTTCSGSVASYIPDCNHLTLSHGTTQYRHAPFEDAKSHRRGCQSCQR